MDFHQPDCYYKTCNTALQKQLTVGLWTKSLYTQKKVQLVLMIVESGKCAHIRKTKQFRFG